MPSSIGHKTLFLNWLQIDVADFGSVVACHQCCRALLCQFAPTQSSQPMPDTPNSSQIVAHAPSVLGSRMFTPSPMHVVAHLAFPVPCGSSLPCPSARNKTVGGRHRRGGHGRTGPSATGGERSVTCRICSDLYCPVCFPNAKPVILCDIDLTYLM